MESEVEDWEYTRLEIIGGGFPKFVWVTFKGDSHNHPRRMNDKATTLDQVIGYFCSTPQDLIVGMFSL